MLNNNIIYAYFLIKSLQIQRTLRVKKRLTQEVKVRMPVIKPQSTVRGLQHYNIVQLVFCVFVGLCIY